MKKTIIFAVAMAMTSMVACSTKQEYSTGDEHVSSFQKVKGDSTIYGLACDGCTDSVLVLLTSADVDPDTFDIIDAHQDHRVYGRPRIGDELAVVVNPDDPQEAQKVIVLDDLKGQWCYQVAPKLRNIDQMPRRMQRRMLDRMPDSLRHTLLVPREYSIKLKRGFTVQSIGGGPRQTTSDDMSPVEYPPIKRYTEWHIYNGKLLLTAGTLNIPGMKETAKPTTDTADIVLLMRDSLILRFNDHVQSYYRKVDSTQVAQQ